MSPLKSASLLTSAVVATALLLTARASAPPSAGNTGADAPVANPATIPTPHADTAVEHLERTKLVLDRARRNAGRCDVIFIGDSITERWEDEGRNVWRDFYGERKCWNLGVGGDRTEQVLWRFAHGNLDGLDPKVAVLMIGTNNVHRNENTEAQLLEGVQTVVKQLRERLPGAQIILMATFPRGKTFNQQRGKLAQVNQALAKLADDHTIFFIDIGSKLIEPDGSISLLIMGDGTHLTERGYQVWAEAIEPTLNALLQK